MHRSRSLDPQEAKLKAQIRSVNARATMSDAVEGARDELASTAIWLTPCELFGNFYSLAPPPYFLIRNAPPPYFSISSPNSSQGVNQMAVDGIGHTKIRQGRAKGYKAGM